jgi:Arc/MetJ-type ribon-helix-helix transcriptional regulator
MQAHLAPAETEFVLAAIASGKYRDESEALNEAVRLLRRRDELLAVLDVGAAELDAGMGIPAEEAFDRLERVAADLDRGAGGLPK